MNSKIKFACTALFIFISNMIFAQCGNGSTVEIATQDSLNKFGIKISGCTTYNGGIKLLGFLSDITNLTPLSPLQNITGDFWVFNTNATTLSGLNNLTTLGGGFLVQNNHFITNVDPLINLSTISSYFLFSNNQALLNLDGLISLSVVSGNANISYNNNLVSCCGIFPLIYANGVAGGIVFGPNNGACNTIAEVLNGGYISVNLTHCFTTLNSAISYATTNNGIVGTHLNIENTSSLTIPSNVTMRIYDGAFTNKSTIINDGLISLNGGAFENNSLGIYKGKGVFNGSFVNNGIVAPGH